MTRKPRWLDLPSRPGRPGLLAGAIASVVGGFLWVLATPPYGLWPLAWIAALPTLWAIDQAPTPRRAGLWGGLTAVTFTAGGFPWIVDLLTRFGGLPTPLAWLGLLVVAAIHGVVYLLGARVIRSLRDRRREHLRGPWPMALCGALGFFAIEIVAWTPFPFTLAISQAAVRPIRGLAAFAGPSAITALMVAACGSIIDVFTAQRRRRFLPAGVTAAFAVVMFVGSFRGSGSGERTLVVGVVQPNLPMDAPDSMEARRAELRALQDATASLEARGAQLVVWSEASYPFHLLRDQTHDFDEGSGYDAYRIRRGFTVPVVVGAITSVRRGAQWNSAILVTPDGRFAARDDKVHRMIGSEYNPLIEWFPSARKLMPAGAGSYAGGDRPAVLEAEIDGHPLRIVVAICLEDVMPGYGRDLAALDPDLLVNVTNDSWFGHDEPLQHEALARFRPVELGVPMVRAVNTGPSAVFDRDGNVVARTAVRDGGAPETLLATISVGGRDTSFYAGWGGPLGWVVAIGTLVWWLAPWVIVRFRRGRAPPAPAAAPAPTRSRPPRKSGSRR